MAPVSLPDVGGVVMVTANAWARGDAARCPCPVALTLDDETPGAASDRDRDRIGPWSDIATLNTRHVFPIDAGETKSFTARGSLLDPHGADVDYVVRLTAVFMPVPAESDNTLRQP